MREGRSRRFVLELQKQERRGEAYFDHIEGGSPCHVDILLMPPDVEGELAIREYR